MEGGGTIEFMKIEEVYITNLYTVLSMGISPNLNT